MEKWYIKNLGEASFADESLERIKTLFRKEFENANKPDDMAIFIKHESERGLHCEVKLYFSPETANLAKSLNAIPCPKPSSHSLDIFTGSKKARAIFFREK